MKANHKVDTQPEKAIRSRLHAAGLRFRKDFPVNLPGRRRTRIDIAFTKAKVAVYVDGCFWHACPDHGTTPTSNQSYWKPKLTRNVQRDREIDALLTADGWTVIRIWEHEAQSDAATMIIQAVRRLHRDETPPRTQPCGRRREDHES